MKEYQSVEIRLLTFNDDIVTQSFNEFEEQKSGLDNVFEDVEW